MGELLKDLLWDAWFVVRLVLWSIMALLAFTGTLVVILAGCLVVASYLLNLWLHLVGG